MKQNRTNSTEIKIAHKKIHIKLIFNQFSQFWAIYSITVSIWFKKH